MNNKRRKLIEKIVDDLYDLQERLEEVKGEEEDYKDAIPGSFEARIEKAESVCASLDEACEFVSSILEVLNNMEY